MDSELNQDKIGEFKCTKSTKSNQSMARSTHVDNVIAVRLWLELAGISTLCCKFQLDEEVDDHDN